MPHRSATISMCVAAVSPTFLTTALIFAVSPTTCRRGAFVVTSICAPARRDARTSARYWLLAVGSNGRFVALHAAVDDLERESQCFRFARRQNAHAVVADFVLVRFRGRVTQAAVEVIFHPDVSRDAVAAVGHGQLESHILANRDFILAARLQVHFQPRLARCRGSGRRHVRVLLLRSSCGRR